jgi:hypothetical protein
LPDWLGGVLWGSSPKCTWQNGLETGQNDPATILPGEDNSPERPAADISWRAASFQPRGRFLDQPLSPRASSLAPERARRERRLMRAIGTVSGTVRRREPADDLRLCQADLETLIADTEASGRSRPSTADLEERAQLLARAIVAAFRGPVRPVHAPIFSRGGRALW